MLGVIGDGTTSQSESIPGGPAVPGPSWTHQFVFPAAVIGPAHLVAACSDPSTGTQPFAFNPLAIDVQTDRRLLVVPASSASPGSTLAITSQGPGCDQISTVEIELQRSSTAVQVAPTIAGDQQTQWRASIVLPSDLRPGPYTVIALMFDMVAVDGAERAVDVLVGGLDPDLISASSAMALVGRLDRMERRLAGAKMVLAGRVADSQVWKHPRGSFRRALAGWPGRHLGG
jgi:hypothetical protein